jgi:hypothetical protein
MKKLTLLSVGILSFASLFLTTSCGDIKSDIEFEKYSNNVTETEFYEKFNKLEVKNINQYTLNKTFYYEHESNNNNITNISKRNNKEEIQFNYETNAYLEKTELESYYKDSDTTITERNKTSTTKIKKDDLIYTYDNLSKTYTKSNLNTKYFNYSETIDPKFELENLLYDEGKHGKIAEFYIDENQYTAIVKINYTENPIIDSSVTATVEKTNNIMFQIELNEKEIIIRSKNELVVTGSYFYKTEVSFNSKTLQMFEYKYSLEAPNITVNESDYSSIESILNYN